MKTGQARVFSYYFAHLPPYPQGSPFAGWGLGIGPSCPACSTIKSVESILRNSLDQAPPSAPPPASTPPHDNIRGSEYFE